MADLRFKEFFFSLSLLPFMEFLLKKILFDSAESGSEGSSDGSDENTNQQVYTVKHH